MTGSLRVKGLIEYAGRRRDGGSGGWSGGNGGSGGGGRGVRMVGHPRLAQSTFDNMGAEASALRESLVIVRKRQYGIICFYIF